MKLVIELPGEPRGKGRPRFGKGHVYTPAPTAAYERSLAWAAKRAMKGQKPLTGPLCVTVTAFIDPPKSWSQQKRRDAISETWAVCKPDIDNIAKIALDSLNGIVWEDDVQVARLHVARVWAFDVAYLRIEVESCG